MRWMRWMGAAAAAGALALGAAAVQAQTPPVLKIGVEGAYPPFSEIGTDGKLKGFDIDIANALCERMKVRCTLVQMEFDALIPGLRAKKIDAIVASMSITPERRKAVDFSVKYYHTPARLVAKAGATLDTSPAGLKGRKIGVQRLLFGFAALLGGLEATSIHTLHRHTRLERLTVMEVTSQLVAVLVSVAGAWLDRRYYGPNHEGAAWVFVGANLLASLVRVAWSPLALPGHRHHFRLERAALTELLGFGRWVFLSTLLTFMAGQADRLVFGKLIPLDLFGVYGIAAALAMLPTLAVLRVGASVAFPTYARLAARGELGPLLGRVRLPLLLGGGAIVSGLFACGPYLIQLLYDDRYVAAGWILRFLAIGAWFQIMEATSGAALLALGRVSWMAAGSAAKLACLVALIPLGFHLDGFRGALVGLVAADVAKYLVAATGMVAQRLAGSRLDAGTTLLIALISAAGLAAGALVEASSPSRLAAFLAAGAASGGAWAAILGWYFLRERARRLVAPAVT